MKKEIIEAIKNSNANFIGIRHLTDDENYQVGDSCRTSYDWDYEKDMSSYDTDEPQLLSGTCAYDTKIELDWDEEDEIKEKLEEAIKASSCYCGNVAIIAGNRSEYGADENEIIIEDAIVVALLD